MKTLIAIMMVLFVFMPTVCSTKIIDVRWTADNPNNKVIEVLFDMFPGWEKWKDWEMYVDGNKWPMEGRRGNAIVRPNKDLNRNPTGVFIGTIGILRFPDNLWGVDFPCCGTINFSIPDHGFTNTFHYNLIKQGCLTKSEKICDGRFLNVIENQAQFDSLLGQKGFIAYLAPRRHIPAKEPFTDECYFQDTKNYPDHLSFLNSFNELKKITPDEYYSYALIRNTRIWWCGRIQFLNDNNILTYTIWTKPEEDILEADITEVDDILKKNIPYKKTKLAFWPIGQYNTVKKYQGNLRRNGINVYV